MPGRFAAARGVAALGVVTAQRLEEVERMGFVPRIDLTPAYADVPPLGLGTNAVYADSGSWPKAA